MPTGSPLGDRRVTAEEHAQEWETLYTNELCPALGTTSINFTVWLEAPYRIHEMILMEIMKPQTYGTIILSDTARFRSLTSDNDSYFLVFLVCPLF